MRCLSIRFAPAWLVLAVLFHATVVVAAVPWQGGFYLDGDGYWQCRVRVTIDNATPATLDGRPIGVAIGNAAGQADLVGADAQTVRVCDAAGKEMLFALIGPAGETIVDGPLPTGGSVVIPVECPAGGKADYFIYVDNPSAGLVSEFLAARLGLVNGDIEHGSGPTPTGWQHDEPDAAHRATWSDERPQSGKRCLKTVVADGAESTWIASRQHGIPIVGGARYVLRGYVRAENVTGRAGWYIHLGNRGRSMITSPMAIAGEGTFDWREVSASFTAPADADRASLGTVLYGTGTAWFDNLTLERLDAQPPITAHAATVETMQLRDVRGDLQVTKPVAAIKARNFSDQQLDDTLVTVRMTGRLRNVATRNKDLGVVFGLEAPPLCRAGQMLVFPASLPPRSESTFQLVAVQQGDALPAYQQLLAHASNLVVDPSLELDVGATGAWSSTPVGDRSRCAIDDSGAARWGRRCLITHVAADAPPGWRGWHQSVPVEPGRTYVVAAWVKTQDVTGEVRIHMHCHTASGAHCQDDPMRSAGGGISGTTDWTLLLGRTTMPPDAARMTLHLTTNATGTVWHDGVLVAPAVAGVATFTGQQSPQPNRLVCWPTNAVVKTFPDDMPPPKPVPAIVELARNEQEPLQLAIRGPQAVQDVRVQVGPLTNADGAKLPPPEVNVVGFVPIDYPTSYYRSDAPAWHRKAPGQPPRCDGWPGMWPDPLLPTGRFDLVPNTTAAVWITFATTADTPPGEYRGGVRLTAGGETIAQVPLTVRVWDFTLPQENHVAAIYDVRLGRAAELWGKDLDAMYPVLVDFMAKRRLCPDTIRPLPRIEYRDGRVVADFTAYDRAAKRHFDELKMPYAYTPWTFYQFGWGHPPRTMFGERPYPGEPPFDDADRGQLRLEFKRAYQACLRVYWEHMKENGWHDRVVLYVSDEPFYTKEHIIEQMKAVCEMIHEVDPAIPIYSSTWSHVPQWDDSLDIWGLSHYGRVPVEQMRKIRQAGKRIWFTTDGQMCTDTPYCAVERLLPHYCFKYDVEAYEFWGVAWLTQDPYRYGWHRYIHQSDEPGNSYWVRYPNGDGFLIYPGHLIGHDGPVSSVRLEQAREGVEDFEYLYLLRALTARAKAAGRDTAVGDAALQAASALVDIPNAGGRYSTEILPDPDAVPRLRRQLAAAIQRLSATE